MSAFCGCGREAGIELRFPAVERYRGTGEVWQPFCEDCYHQHLQNAAEVNAHEMDRFGGAYGLVEWEERSITRLQEVVAQDEGGAA